MRLQNLATSQLRADEDPTFVIDEHPEFFGEYFRAFDDENEFREMLDRAVERARTRHDTPDNIGAIVEAARRAEQQVEPVFEAAGLHGCDTELFVFIGRGMWDGHGMAGGDRPRWFLDMTLINEHLTDEDFALDVHLVHEMIHAVHYLVSPGFRPAFDKSFRRLIVDQFVAEGLATRVSRRITGCEEGEALWFGSLDAGEFETWRNHARQQRGAIGEKLSELDDGNDENGGALNEKLFRIPDDLVRGRIGYLYGRDIVAEHLEDRQLGEVLERPPQAWEADVRDYFRE